jgi:uncharacterized protein YcaQ
VTEASPAGQRRFGYYALPPLVDGRLIARVDAKLHRGERSLELRHVGCERWFAAGEEAPLPSWGTVTRERGVAGLAAAAWSLAAFTGAERVQLGRVTPGCMRAAIEAAIRSGAGDAR